MIVSLNNLICVHIVILDLILLLQWASREVTVKSKVGKLESYQEIDEIPPVY